MSKIILVGESNPYGGTDEFALYPVPDGCSGHRLCCLILGMRRSHYLETFVRSNLCTGPWRIRDARKRAVELLRENLGGKFILFGRKVCDGFGVPFVPFTVADGILLRLPHPSGLNRMWQEDGAVDKARRAVIAFAPEVAPLIGVDS
jgi:hypothetical protein